jgi:Uma2 family endonuclease
MSTLYLFDDIDIKVPMVMTPEEYDALPEGFGAEIVDGVLHPVNRPTSYHQLVLDELGHALKSRVPRDLVVLREVAIRFMDAPLHERHPDLVVARRSGFDPFASKLRPDQVLLVVEVVSPGSETADRIQKPAEYAFYGIPFFWRVEIQRAPVPSESTLTIHTFRHEEGVYRRIEVFGPTAVISVPGLEWAEVPVADLIPRI